MLFKKVKYENKLFEKPTVPPYRRDGWPGTELIKIKMMDVY